MRASLHASSTYQGLQDHYDLPCNGSFVPGNYCVLLDPLEVRHCCWSSRPGVFVAAGEAGLV